MKKGKSVSRQQLDWACYDVQKQLANLGLWEESGRLRKVDVYWCPIPQLLVPDALGFYLNTSGLVWRGLGYRAGHIYIPRWVLAQVWKQERGSLRAILRHEYGHALAFAYPTLIRRSRKFAEAFGAPHDEGHDGGMWEEHGDAAFVSNYAQTSPSEDFAETFELFVRYGGKIPVGFRNRILRKKWAFIRDAVRQIARGKTSWK